MDNITLLLILVVAIIAAGLSFRIVRLADEGEDKAAIELGTWVVALNALAVAGLVAVGYMYSMASRAHSGLGLMWLTAGLMASSLALNTAALSNLKDGDMKGARNVAVINGVAALLIAIGVVANLYRAHGPYKFLKLRSN